MCVPVWFAKKEPAFPFTDQRIISLDRGTQFVTTAGVRPTPIFVHKHVTNERHKEHKKTRRPKVTNFMFPKAGGRNKLYVLIQNRNPDLADMAMADMARVLILNNELCADPGVASQTMFVLFLIIAYSHMYEYKNKYKHTYT